MADRPLRRFLWLYPLANGGAYLAFMPLLTVILPLRAEAIAGHDKVALLSIALIIGVCVATGANIVGGILSDWTRARFGSRRLWLWLGFGSAWASYATIAAAHDTVGLIGALALFQFCFNLAFGPFVALYADKVPDRVKGSISAVVNLGLSIGALGGALVSLPIFATSEARILGMGLLSAACILPLLVVWPRPLPDVSHDEPALSDLATPARGWSSFRSLWLAKFLVQISGNVITTFFLFYLKDAVGGPMDEVKIGFARAIVVGTVLTAACGIGVGRWSDRTGRRKPFLLGGIALMASGLLLLALLRNWAAATAGFAFFQAGLGVFGTVDSALVAQVLPSELNRGRDLGFMNGANTLPALIGPMIALLSLGGMDGGYTCLFLMLVLGLCASALTLAVTPRLV